MNKTAEVVIIGGGLIGSSVAYYLAKKKVPAVLIERKEGLCSGASGANQGGCPLQLFTSPVLELITESLKLYKNLAEEIDYDIEYYNSGCLIGSVDEKQRPALEKHSLAFQQKGFDVRIVEGKEIQELEPVLGKDVVVGVEEEYSSLVNPFKVTHGFARAAQKMGAEFILSAGVKDIETSRGRVTAVITDKGAIKTDVVVNAAGAWSSEIGRMVGLDIPVIPQRGQVIVTDSLPFNRRWRYILDADYLTIAFDAGKVAKSKDTRIRLGVAGSYAQADSGNWTIASSRDFAGFDNKVTMHALSYMAERAIKFMPRFKDVNFIRAYAGLRPFCYTDGLPILGKVDNPSGFVIATGHAGEGVALAPITGKLISELITEDKTSMPIDAFAFSRLLGQ